MVQLKMQRHFVTTQNYCMIMKNSTHFQLLDDLKQLCFYLDVFSKGKMSIPSKVANKDIALSILEIWIKHLKPIWKQDMDKMKQALVNCYSELEEKKLIEKGSTSKMSDFLR